MKLIIGLGNPGKKYEKTRHNVGFMVLDELAGGEKWGESKKVKAQYIKMRMGDENVELLKPQTFMNESGRAVAYAANKNGVSPADILVIHDDVDIPLGEIKIQEGRGAAGHNGVKSIIQHLGTKDFTRIRVGVGVAPLYKGGRGGIKKPTNTSNFVLKRFGLLEKRKLSQAITAAAEAVEKWLK
jgi:PTH1 family peptidyl-tRNA hydrolase